MMRIRDRRPHAHLLAQSGVLIGEDVLADAPQRRIQVRDDLLAANDEDQRA